MKQIITILFILLSISVNASENLETPYNIWLVGASFSIGPTMHEPGPRLGQQLASLVGDNGLTIRGDAGHSAYNLFEEGKYLLNKYGHDPADFLIIDVTGSVFYERDKLIYHIKNLISLYKKHPVAKYKTTVLVNSYPTLAGGNWFTEQYFNQKTYDIFNNQFESMVKSSGGILVNAWEHWQSNNYPHPQLNNKPDYHPTGKSSRRAAITLLYTIENIWACNTDSKSQNCE